MVRVVEVSYMPLQNHVSVSCMSYVKCTSHVSSFMHSTYLQKKPNVVPYGGKT
jgi:hypothetical protein